MFSLWESCAEIIWIFFFICWAHLSAITALSVMSVMQQPAHRHISKLSVSAFLLSIFSVSFSETDNYWLMAIVKSHFIQALLGALVGPLKDIHCLWVTVMSWQFVTVGDIALLETVKCEVHFSVRMFTVCTLIQCLYPLLCETSVSSPLVLCSLV